jgi:hypothetical protein
MWFPEHILLLRRALTIRFSKSTRFNSRFTPQWVFQLRALEEKSENAVSVVFGQRPTTTSPVMTHQIGKDRTTSNRKRL